MLSLSRNQIPEHLRNYFKPKRVYKPKDDMMIPHRVFDALMADGWYGRMDICWSKLNPMPESVTDRPTKSHEYLFLLTKKPRYFYDAEAIKESDSGKPSGNGYKRDQRLSYEGRGQDEQWQPEGGRNKRSVWTVTTRPYSGAHFATFPPALIEPCIKAGTSERGVCEECGALWERVVERKATGYEGSRYGERAVDATGGAIGGGTKESTLGSSNGKGTASYETTGWRPTCSCNAGTIPATVLDPFMGSGTTAHTARRLGRRSIGLELDSRCEELIQERMGYQEVLL